MPGRYARHNSSYWSGDQYLGVGPAAHSFNGQSRQWNIANNAKYIQALAENRIPFEQEILSLEQRYNEYVMTSLRTMWGCDLNKMAGFGPRFQTHFLGIAAGYIESGHLVEADGFFRLSTEGKLLADGIASDLFWLES